MSGAGGDRIEGVPIVMLRVCEQGDVAETIDSGQRGTLVRHGCGEYAWEDGRFCGWCGGAMPRLEAEVFAHGSGHHVDGDLVDGLPGRAGHLAGGAQR